MIMKLHRIRLHPWNLFNILRTAVTRHTEGATVESRQLAAEAQRAIRSIFDADEPMIECPYIAITPGEVSKRKLRNEELRGCEFWREHPDYRPLPNTSLSSILDVGGAVRKFCLEAVEALCRSKEVSNDFAEGLTDTLDAIRSAETVEVNTASAAKAPEG